MKRMILRFAAAALLGPLLLHQAAAQDGGKPRKVGVIATGVPSNPATKRALEELSHGLREYGWQQGRNVVLEVRFVGPDPARLPELVAELVALKVDVIMTSNMEVVDAARQATASVPIPIVMAGAMNPVQLGSVASLARPGGNVTGVVNQAETVAAKSFELLKELNAGIKRVAIIYGPDNVASLVGFNYQKEEVAPRLGLSVLPIPVFKPADFEVAFATIVRERPDALVLHAPAVVVAHRERIIAFAVEQRLPTASPFSSYTHAGLLMSYGGDQVQAWRHAASFVDRILKGAAPAELPLEQMNRFQLVVNLKTAKAIGITIPSSILVRADEVIE